MDGKFIIHTVSMFVKYISLIFYFLIISLKILVESILKDKVNHIVFCFTACPMPSNILQTIFIDYYEHTLYELHPRKTEIEYISKMIHCGVPSYGGALW